MGEMSLKEAVNIVEDMCFRYGEPHQKGRTAEQEKEVIALNIVLKEVKSGGKIND